MKKSWHKQKGFLAIAAITLILIGGMVAAVIGHIGAISAEMSGEQDKSTEAFYLAEAGLHRAIYALTTSVAADQETCSSINGNADFTNVNLGAGQFTVTTTTTFPNPVATLSSAINNSTTIIPMSTLSGYASSGRVIIDHEAIDYTGTSSNSATCSGNAPCLTGATRGTAGTTAVLHASGTAVAQNQCHIVSQGAVPNFSSYDAKRQVSSDYLQDEAGWAVGKNNNGELILYWNGASWSRAGPYSSISNKDLNSIYLLSYADGWAVGKNKTIARWNGSAWLGVSTTNLPNKTLESVTCIDANDCWTVGKSRTFAHWNGSSWSNGTVDTSGSDKVPNKDIYSVSCTTSNNCWAVGKKDSSGGGGDDDDDDDDDDGGGAGGGSSQALFVHWNGSRWYRVFGASSVSNQDLYSVDCVSANDCWAVGKSKTIAHWDGSQWTGVSTSGLPNKNLNEVTCTASNNCWAVGKKSGGSGVILHYDGSSWTRNTSGSIPNKDLLAVSCVNANNCWAAGYNKTILHWNGVSWGAVSTSGLPNKQLYSIQVLGPKFSTANTIIGNWEEEFG